MADRLAWACLGALAAVVAHHCRYLTRLTLRVEKLERRQGRG